MSSNSDYERGWVDGMEQAATWHDEREKRMREAAEHADRDLQSQCIERANWHRDCAQALRDFANE